MRWEPEKFSGRWESILSACGVDAKLMNRRNQPCPSCGGKDRFRWTNHDGKGGFYCSHCGPGDGLQLLMIVSGKDFKGAVDMVLSLSGESVMDAKRMDEPEALRRAKAVWDMGRAIREGDPVWLYLRGRGYMGVIPKSLRHVPVLRLGDDQFPAMVALVRSVDDKSVNVHRTWLKNNGKERKIMAGSLPDGCAIRLGPVAEEMGIAEGIETALMASQRFGLPVWSAMSEGGLRKFRPPEGVKRLVIFGDNDRNFVGQSAAYDCAKLVGFWADKIERRIELSVQIPDAPGTDWADRPTQTEMDQTK